jgi:hypothetical protein
MTVSALLRLAATATCDCTPGTLAAMDYHGRIVRIASTAKARGEGFTLYVRAAGIVASTEEGRDRAGWWDRAIREAERQEAARATTDLPPSDPT